MSTHAAGTGIHLSAYQSYGRGQGGMLSDAAIIARERRIQTVVGVRPATERIHDGDILRVDGTSGYVKIIVKG